MYPLVSPTADAAKRQAVRTTVRAAPTVRVAPVAMATFSTKAICAPVLISTSVPRVLRQHVVCERYLPCTGTDGCQHTCVNEQGSYRCECAVGFTLAGDEHTCTLNDKTRGNIHVFMTHSVRVSTFPRPCQFVSLQLVTLPLFIGQNQDEKRMPVDVDGLVTGQLRLDVYYFDSAHACCRHVDSTRAECELHIGVQKRHLLQVR